MSRRILIMAVAVLIAFAGGLGLEADRTILAQDATPAAEPVVVIVDAMPEYLAVEIVPNVVAAPAVMELVRVTLAPGAVLAFPERRDSEPMILVEAGTMTAR
ncbi:MAG: hypothetical protein M3509_12670, partial [Chloroflexota bacterium]|nr:hypothetical protein [Chloroflexota bacterium]